MFIITFLQRLYVITVWDIIGTKLLFGIKSRFLIALSNMLISYNEILKLKKPLICLAYYSMFLN